MPCCSPARNRLPASAISLASGGAIGSQVSAAIVTATIAAGRLPTARGFTIAFAAAAVARAIGFVVALHVPAPARVAADAALAEAA